MNKLEELYEECGVYIDPHSTTATRKEIEFYAEQIVKKCIELCGEIATEADAMTKSKYVTDAGRMLHEGMWGGATNCAANIRNYFGVNDE